MPLPFHRLVLNSLVLANMRVMISFKSLCLVVAFDLMPTSADLSGPEMLQSGPMLSVRYILPDLVEAASQTSCLYHGGPL